MVLNTDDTDTEFFRTISEMGHAIEKYFGKIYLHEPTVEWFLYMYGKLFFYSSNKGPYRTLYTPIYGEEQIGVGFYFPLGQVCPDNACPGAWKEKTIGKNTLQDPQQTWKGESYLKSDSSSKVFTQYSPFPQSGTHLALGDCSSKVNDREATGIKKR